MIQHAETNCCSVILSENILDGWIPPVSQFVTSCAASSSHACVEKSGQEWYLFNRSEDLWDFPESQCSLALLRKYFAVNSTHALGRMCPSTPHAALHVRSGDVAQGYYDQGLGTYRPTSQNSGYWFHPTSFYAAVVRNIRRRDLGLKIIIFCEDMNNPTCDFFQKVASLGDNNIEMRVARPLLDDLFTMLCAQEIATSNGSFKRIFRVSTFLRVLHHFSLSKIKCAQEAHEDSKLRSVVAYWIKDDHMAATFANDTRPWKNTGYQRFLANRAVDMDFCDKPQDAFFFLDPLL